LLFLVAIALLVSLAVAASAFLLSRRAGSGV
jgi:hypothetical protein